MHKKLTVFVLAAAALATSACVTVIDAGDGGDYAWTGQGAQPFDAARDACRDRAGKQEGTTAFITCMAEKGWTRTND
ncbi:MAG: hypothetical protein KJ676_02540 [Alphaproteobacteria bacterium]|nr:hypothetical protein [Alphaproteobacteria bacterium]MBU1524774.1 hypothetical protein [Alphaproteobacteria bacterium]MBU2116927.1 hypothetical protein [Alphaproteobacteria bacterium]MBU2351282.1 hypothetical protein [Alphaproteobacteria bacterium]MBU2381047.1 hypothetical protein [Alphaproteobacteria bacterium]